MNVISLTCNGDCCETEMFYNSQTKNTLSNILDTQFLNLALHGQHIDLKMYAHTFFVQFKNNSQHGDLLP